jgi:hypothetical protein
MGNSCLTPSRRQGTQTFPLSNGMLFANELQLLLTAFQKTY